MNMYTGKENEFTEQGADPPVPVGVESGRAGSPRPLASNCPATPVDSQAGAPKATGLKAEEQKDPIIARPKLARTPPTKRKMLEAAESATGSNAKESETPIPSAWTILTLPRRRGSLDGTGGNGSMHAEEQESKRKKTGQISAKGSEATGSPENESDSFRRAMTEINKQVQQLGNVLSTSYKPRKDLIEINAKLRYYINQLLKTEQTTGTVIRPDDERATRHHEEVRSLQDRVAALERGSEDLKRELRDAKENEHLLRGRVEKLQRRLQEADSTGKTSTNIEKIKCVLSSEKDFAKLGEIMDENWPEEVYERIHLKSGKPYRGDLEEDVAVFVDPTGTGSGQALDELRTIYPVLAPLLEEGLTEGVMDFVSTETRYTSKKKTDKQGFYTNSVYVLPMAMSDREMADAELMFKLCRQLGSENAGKGQRKIRMEVIGKMDLLYLRKCAEFALRDTKTQVTLWSRDNLKLRRGKPEIGGAKERPTKDKVIVKVAKGRSYADLLKTLKGNINLEGSGIQITSIKKTSKGDLLMEVPGGKATTLKQIIKDKSKDAEVTVKTKETIAHITDIDASFDEAGLKKEIAQREGIQEDLFRITSLRPTQNGNQTATVGMKADVAEKIINKGKIRIGWVECRIRRRVNLLRCFRCHLFGHRKEDCPNEDRSKLCLKCTKAGHVAKDCKNAPACIACKEDGHRVDQTKCPYYRKMILEKAGLPAAGKKLKNGN